MSSGRASLCVSFKALESLLHLREGIEVIGIKVNPTEQSVDFIFAGESLPQAQRKCPIVRKPFRELIDRELGE